MSFSKKLCNCNLSSAKFHSFHLKKFLKIFLKIQQSKHQINVMSRYTYFHFQLLVKNQLRNLIFNESQNIRKLEMRIHIIHLPRGNLLCIHGQVFLLICISLKYTERLIEEKCQVTIFMIIYHFYYKHSKERRYPIADVYK